VLRIENFVRTCHESKIAISCGSGEEEYRDEMQHISKKEPFLHTSA